MKIRYQSTHGICQVVVPVIRDPRWNTWTNGEERDVPDDLVVPVVARPGVAGRTAKLVDALLMAGPDFVDAATGKNPDYTCAACGEATQAEGVMVGMTFHRFADANHDPLCPIDFFALNPQLIEPYAAREGVSPDLVDEARKRAKKPAPAAKQLQPKPVQPKPEAAPPSAQE